MLGYFHDDERTRAAFEGGWFHSGDIGVMDEQGRVRIVDRKKDMISVSGFNVFPNEVEDFAMSHGGLLECAVIGVPHPDWGEVGRAVVVVRPDASVDPEELLSFLDGRLARYKIPKSVVFAEELPKSGAGKVLKQVLRRSLGGSAP